MAQPILVRGARQLLTLGGIAGPRRGRRLGELGVIQDGSVLIVDGVIEEVGPTRRVENLTLARDAIEIDATGRVVMPGFVDSHTHLVSGPPIPADFESGGSPRELRASRSAHIENASRKTLQSLALSLIRDCVRHGTTTLEAKSGYGGSESSEMKILRTHAALDRDPIEVVSTFMPTQTADIEGGRSVNDYIDWLCTYLLPLIGRRRLAEYVDVTCDPEVFTTERCRKLFVTARALGFGVKLHGGRGGERGAVSLALEAGATSVDHVTQPTVDEIRALAEAGTIATLLPGSVFYRTRHQYAPARTLVEAGIAVALATNYNPETCPSHNMQMMVALACLEMRMTPAEAIAAATINGAHALGRANRLGSLEHGKQADMLILGASDYREIPRHFGVNLVQTTIRGGEVIYDRPEVTWRDSS
ncbi:MAG TPA: imidazolonepropionase [Bryobacteraceae bacterium]|nr:imidazolonepropionase [Bryobacteraceae bacterium]